MKFGKGKSKEKPQGRGNFRRRDNLAWDDIRHNGIVIIAFTLVPLHRGFAMKLDLLEVLKMFLQIGAAVMKCYCWGILQ
jgi:hypothetical protein